MEHEQVSHARRIRELAERDPDGPAYRHIAIDGSEPAFGWGRLDRRSSQLAGALRGRGVETGDRLGIGLRNSPQLVLCALAAWKIGAVPVPVRWDVPDWELQRLLEVIDPAAYLTPDDAGWIDRTDDLAVPELPDVVSPSVQGICSSGSTGTPKVILAGSPSICGAHYGAPLAAVWGPISRPQTILVLAPMYHVNAFATLYNLLGGDRLVVMEKFDAARILDVVERYRISTFTATPIMLQRIADVRGIETRDLSSIEWIMQGAAPIQPSLVERWIELVGAEKLVMAYGSTEGVGMTAIRGDEWLEHRGSVGRGHRGSQVRVLGPGGEDRPPGEIGEVYLRLPAGTGFGGVRFLGDAPKLPETPDGFRSIGDLGYLDEEGYLYLVDRRVDMIVSGGANVFPAEVELALVDHPKVADVVVIGLRDDEWGRRVHAVVQPADPADPPSFDEIRAFAKARLAAYKVPKSMEIVDEIPRSEATKVNRGRLVEARGG